MGFIKDAIVAITRSILGGLFLSAFRQTNRDGKIALAQSIQIDKSPDDDDDPPGPPPPSNKSE